MAKHSSPQQAGHRLERRWKSAICTKKVEELNIDFFPENSVREQCMLERLSLTVIIEKQKKFKLEINQSG